MADRPIGEMQSSPTVWKKYVTTSHDGLTRLSGEALAAPQASTRNPTARPMSPIPAFMGIDGFRLRLSSQTHAEPKTGASRMMKKEFTDCRKPAGISRPRMLRSV